MAVGSGHDRSVDGGEIQLASLLWPPTYQRDPHDAAELPAELPKAANAKTSCTRSSFASNRARRNKYTATTAPSVFPAAIPAAHSTGSCVSRFATNAPSATPGHKRAPPRKSAATASPLGGHTAVT